MKWDGVDFGLMVLLITFAFVSCDVGKEVEDYYKAKTAILELQVAE